MKKIIKKTKCLSCNSEINITLGHYHGPDDGEMEEVEKENHILLNGFGGKHINFDDFSTMEAHPKDSINISLVATSEYEQLAQIFFYHILTTRLKNIPYLYGGGRSNGLNDEWGRNLDWRFIDNQIYTVGDLIDVESLYLPQIGDRARDAAYELLDQLSNNSLDVNFQFHTGFSKNIYNFYNTLRDCIPIDFQPAAYLL